MSTIQTDGGEVLYAAGSTEPATNKFYELASQLMGAGEDIGSRSEVYNQLVATIKASGEVLKTMAAVQVANYFKHFPASQDAALDAVLDLCESEDQSVRQRGVKAMSKMAREAPKAADKVAAAFCQLISVTEDEGELGILNQELQAVVFASPGPALVATLSQCTVSDAVRAKLLGRAISFINSAHVRTALAKDPDAEHQLAGSVKQLMEGADDASFQRLYNALRGLPMYSSGHDARAVREKVRAARDAAIVEAEAKAGAGAGAGAGAKAEGEAGEAAATAGAADGGAPGASEEGGKAAGASEEAKAAGEEAAKAVSRVPPGAQELLDIVVQRAAVGADLDVADAEGVERVLLCARLALPLLKRGAKADAFVGFLVRRMFTKIVFLTGEMQLKIAKLLASMSDLRVLGATEKQLMLTSLLTTLKAMLETDKFELAVPDGSGANVAAPAESHNFGTLESLLFAFHQLAAAQLSALPALVGFRATPFTGQVDDVVPADKQAVAMDVVRRLQALVQTSAAYAAQLEPLTKGKKGKQGGAGAGAGAGAAAETGVERQQRAKAAATALVAVNNVRTLAAGLVKEPVKLLTGKSAPALSWAPANQKQGEQGKGKQQGKKAAAPATAAQQQQGGGKGKKKKAGPGGKAAAAAAGAGGAGGKRKPQKRGQPGGGGQQGTAQAGGAQGQVQAGGAKKRRRRGKAPGTTASVAMATTASGGKAQPTKRRRPGGAPQPQQGGKGQQQKQQGGKRRRR